ncbi:virulence factor [Neisseria weixii]|uniref:virulence factor n=1 Tax=Neisseria weixii TaxID=1853276 RepID=UPI000BB95F3B|nr:virulence factor [Neisseria weixii]ATD64634.1 virulence factor [Neisseria weixii]
MYAITFDLDTKELEKRYPSASWRKAYDDIADFLTDYGFTRQQGSVYFGDDTVDAVTCVTAVQDLSTEYAWLEESVKDIRMLRIEERNDLMPAIKKNLRRKRNKTNLKMVG